MTGEDYRTIARVIASCRVTASSSRTTSQPCSRRIHTSIGIGSSRRRSGESSAERMGRSPGYIAEVEGDNPCKPSRSEWGLDTDATVREPSPDRRHDP